VRSRQAAVERRKAQRTWPKVRGASRALDAQHALPPACTPHREVRVAHAWPKAWERLVGAPPSLPLRGRWQRKLDWGWPGTQWEPGAERWLRGLFDNWIWLNRFSPAARMERAARNPGRSLNWEA